MLLDRLTPYLTGFGSDLLPETCAPSSFPGIVVSVLVGARLIEIAFNEWPFHNANPILIPGGGLLAWGLGVRMGSFSERL